MEFVDGWWSLWMDGGVYGVCRWMVEFMGGFMFVEKASEVVIRDRDGGLVRAPNRAGTIKIFRGVSR
jgi:hypothetical protein